MGKDLLVNAVRTMNVNDAKNILTGGETSVTTFFAEKTRAPLGVKFLPVVTKATEKVGLANKYNEFAGKAAGFGLVKKKTPTSSNTSPANHWTASTSSSVKKKRRSARTLWAPAARFSKSLWVDEIKSSKLGGESSNSPQVFLIKATHLLT